MELVQIQQFIGTYILVLMRLSGAFIVSPMIGAAFMPLKLRLIVTIAISFALATNIPYISISFLGSEYAILLMKEFSVGFTLGFVFSLVFASFAIAGEMIGMQAGFGMAHMNDPVSNVSAPIVGRIFLLLIGIIFISMNGIHLIIQVVLESFNHFGIDQMVDFKSISREIMYVGGWVFSSALKIALPAVISLLIVNFTFGILTRSSPQMNIFSIGFPIIILCGLVVVWLAMPIVYKHFENNIFTAYEIIESRVFKKDE